MSHIYTFYIQATLYAALKRRSSRGRLEHRSTLLSRVDPTPLRILVLPVHIHLFVVKYYLVHISLPQVGPFWYPLPCTHCRESLLRRSSAPDVGSCAATPGSSPRTRRRQVLPLSALTSPPPCWHRGWPIGAHQLGPGSGGREALLEQVRCTTSVHTIEVECAFPDFSFCCVRQTENRGYYYCTTTAVVVVCTAVYRLYSVLQYMFNRGSTTVSTLVPPKTHYIPHTSLFLKKSAEN